MPGLLRFKRGGRKRRANQSGDGSGTAGAPRPEFHIDSCQYVSVDAGSTLLRLEGRASGEELDVRAVTLVVRADAREETHSLLAPPMRVEHEPVERWQLAFGVPTADVEDPDAQFELSNGEHAVAALPSPAEVAAIEPQPEPEPPSPEEMQDLRTRLERERNSRIRAEEQLGDNSQDLADARAVLEQFEKRCAISERNLTDLRQKLLVAWSESSELRTLLDAREATHESGKSELRRRRSAERELRVLLGRQERDLTAARENVQRRCEELAEELASREAGERMSREELERARAHNISLQDAARAALESFEQTRAEAEQTRVLLEGAQERAAQANADVEASQAEVDVVQTELRAAHAATTEEQSRRDQLAAELEKLQAELEEARSAAHTQRDELERQIEEMKTSESKLHGELSNTRDALESAKSGRRGKLRKALREAESERARLESELTGLLFRLGDLEEKLVETRDLAPSLVGDSAAA